MRDPVLWSTPELALKKKAPQFIVHRFSRILEEQLKKHGLTETKDWK